MKEQIKQMVFQLKDLGYTVQRIERELGFSNGSIGSVMLGKSNLSEYRLLKFREYYLEKVSGKGLGETVEFKHTPKEKIERLEGETAIDFAIRKKGLNQSPTLEINKSSILQRMKEASVTK